MSDPTPTTTPAAAHVAVDQCPNCNAEMRGEFCFACGQPRKGLIRHFGGIVGDFFDSVFNFDSRTVRTLGPLYFKPGRLSTEYFAGRRVRYVTPLRLYFFLSVVAFLLISMVTNIEVEGGRDGATFQVGDKKGEKPITDEERAKILAELEEDTKDMPEGAAKALRENVRRSLEQQAKLPAPGTMPPEAAAEVEKAQAISDAVRRAEEEARLPSITIWGNKRWHPTENPLTFSWLSDDLNVALNAEIEVLARKARRIGDDPAPFFREMFSQAPMALFIILPLFALLLKVMYLFKRRLYMEHMIVALHSHAFLCLSLILIVLLFQLQDVVAPEVIAAAAKDADDDRPLGFWGGLCGWIAGFACAWIPIYLFLMQKRVYRQGWIMTTIKYLIIGTSYIVLLTFGMLLTMLISLIVM